VRQSKIAMKDPRDLRPHPRNKEWYGPPTANSKYKDIKLSMQTRGYDVEQPLKITSDGRVISGVTRHAAALAVGITSVPCILFEPQDQATAELEIEREIIRGNMYRTKTQTMVAREQRAWLEVEKVLGRKRMGQGTDGGPSESTDRVGKIFGESGRTIQRRLKVLGAIEDAESHGDRKKAERLSALLEGNHLVKALDVIAGKTAAPKKPRVEVPPTFNAHNTRAYSEFFEACAKARVQGEVDQLFANLERMTEDAETARVRVTGPATSRP
jgi:ParB-like chromosome segregation protein Spo0J